MTKQTYKLKITKRARKDLRKLTEAVRNTVGSAIEALSSNPRPRGCLKLTDQGLCRIRVGKYRVVYEVRGDELIILVVRVGDRRDVYRGL